MSADVNTKTDARYQNRDEDGLPRWAPLRLIDGYSYLLESTHATEAEAQARIDELRAEKHAAQMSTAANPKFADAGDEFAGPDGQRLYLPVRAAVYHVPNGCQVVVTEKTHQVVERPKPEPKPKKAKKGKKATKKSAKKSAKAEGSE